MSSGGGAGSSSSSKSKSQSARKLNALEAKIHKAALAAGRPLGQREVDAIATDATARINALNFLSSTGLLKAQQDPANGSLLWRAVSKQEYDIKQGLTDDENMVLGFIQSASNQGIWTKHLKTKTELHQTVIDRCLKSLAHKQLIKAVKSVKYPTRKIFMLANLEPSVDLTGGPWYTDNELDTEFIKLLCSACLRFIRDRTFPKQRLGAAPTEQPLFAPGAAPRYPDARQVLTFLSKSRITETAFAEEHVEALLNVLVLDGEIERLPASQPTQFDLRVDESDASDDSDGERSRKSRKRKKKASRASSKTTKSKRRRRRTSSSDEDDEDDEGEGEDEDAVGSDEDPDALGSDVSTHGASSHARASSSNNKKGKTAAALNKKRKRTRSFDDDNVNVGDDDDDKEDVKVKVEDIQNRTRKKKRRREEEDEDEEDSEEDEVDSSDDSARPRRANQSRSRRNRHRDRNGRKCSKSRTSRHSSPPSSLIETDEDEDEDAVGDSDDSRATSRRSRARRRSSSKRRSSLKREDSSPPPPSYEPTNAADGSIGGVVYRAIRQERVAAQSGLAHAPCGACPVFDFCAPGGPVAPASCEYFTGWLGAAPAGYDGGGAVGVSGAVGRGKGRKSVLGDIEDVR